MKTTLAILIGLTIMVLALPAVSDDGPTGMGPVDRPQEYTAKGGLFTVKMIPGQKESKLIVIGNDVADVKINQLDITGTLKAGKTEKVIKFKRNRDYFSTNQPINKGDLHLRLLNRQTKKTDIIQFQKMEEQISTEEKPKN